MPVGQSDNETEELDQQPAGQPQHPFSLSASGGVDNRAKVTLYSPLNAICSESMLWK